MQLPVLIYLWHYCYYHNSSCYWPSTKKLVIYLYLESYILVKPRHGFSTKINRPYRVNKNYANTTLFLSFKSGSTTTFNTFTVKNSILQSFILKGWYLNQWINLIEKLGKYVSTFAVLTMFYSPPSPRNIILTICSHHPIILRNPYC